MRKIKREGSDTEYTVYEHIILCNLWEYYVIEDTDSDIKLCLVVGAETELGTVFMSEIEPYIICKDNRLGGLMPPPGYDWVE